MCQLTINMCQLTINMCQLTINMFVLEFQRALKFGAKVRLLRGKGCRKMRQNVSQNATKCKTL